MSETISSRNSLDLELKAPSLRLERAMTHCLDFGESLRQSVKKVFEIGKTEGYDPIDLATIFRKKLRELGASKNQIKSISIHFPEESKDPMRVKAQRRVYHSFWIRKNGGSESESEGEKKDEEMTDAKPDNYDTERLNEYTKSFLIKIIHHLEQKITKLATRK